MITSSQISPSFAYIETTIPAGVTAAEYRSSLPRRRNRRQRLLDALRPQLTARTA